MPLANARGSLARISCEYFYISFSDSRAIFRPIYEVLNEQNISVQHRHYSYTIPSIIPATYLLLRFLSLVGPSSYINSTFCLLGCILIQKLVERLLEKAGYSNNNYNVDIHVPSRTIKTTLSSIEESKRIVRNVSFQRQAIFMNRFNMSPVNPENASALVMRRVTI